jgi:Mg2+ and Co2+ transporter CorA
MDFEKIPQSWTSAALFAAIVLFIVGLVAVIFHL